MVQEYHGEYSSLRTAVESIAPKIGCVPQTLLSLVQRHEIDTGVREDGRLHERPTKVAVAALSVAGAFALAFGQSHGLDHAAVRVVTAHGVAALNGAALQQD
jgi:hypothetical protein